MRFVSMLYETIDAIPAASSQAPECFKDLNLDQMVETLVSEREEYELAPFFYAFPVDVATIHYRQEIGQELGNGELWNAVQEFAGHMRQMRRYLTQAHKLSYPYQRERWFTDAVGLYCHAVQGLQQQLATIGVGARGWVRLRDYLTAYVQSDAFLALVADTRALSAELDSVHYMLHIHGKRVDVRPYEGEPDYSADVEATFARFQHGASKDYRVKFSTWPDFNAVEARIMDLVAQWFPQVFAHLDAYYTERQNYLDDIVARFDREVQVYLAYLEYAAVLRLAGLPLCFPQVLSAGQAVQITAGYDMVLAHKLVVAKTPVICNDFQLKTQERIAVVSGPNQGGKTTFARMVGQIHYWAGLGLPVAAATAQVGLCDQIFTHFEKAESPQTSRGKLQDDLVRVHAIIRDATPASLIILNEIFSSTTLHDAEYLGKQVMHQVLEQGSLCVLVTFLDELATLAPECVSLVSTVDPQSPARRTYQIVRRPADGLAYALVIAAQYGLTYSALGERLP